MGTLTFRKTDSKFTNITALNGTSDPTSSTTPDCKAFYTYLLSWCKKARLATDPKGLEEYYEEILDLRAQLPKLYESARGVDASLYAAVAEADELMRTYGDDWLGRVGPLIGKQRDKNDGSQTVLKESTCETVGGEAQVDSA